MSKAYDSLQVIIGISTGVTETDTSWLEAAIESEDNGDVTDYIIGTRYLCRLYKGIDIISVNAFSNFGGVGLSSGNITADITDEIIVFSGSEEASLDKPLYGNISLTLVGSAYTKNGTIVTPTIIKTQGSKKLTCNQEIWAVYLASYKTKYDQYWFQGNRTGTMLIFFVGDTES